MEEKINKEEEITYILEYGCVKSKTYKRYNN